MAGHSKADELFALYAVQQGELRDYFMQGQRFLAHLAIELRDYLGLPEYFEKFDGGREDWVRLYNWDAQTQKAERAPSPFDLQNVNESGELEAAIGVAISHELNSFPKKYFYAVVRVKPRQSDFVVALGPDRGQVFRFEKSEPDLTPFFDAMFSLLKDTLAKSVYDAGAFSPSRQIGFL